MHIRNATLQDLPELQTVYAHARMIMQQSGNPTQWGTDKPRHADICADIQAKQCYIIERKTEKNTEILGAFAFILGEDPSYSHIDGAWLNNAPYGTIHRLASAGKAHGIFSACIDFCAQHSENLRIDTHRDNHIMRKLITKHGFHECGIITLADGPRIAFQRESLR